MLSKPNQAIVEAHRRGYRMVDGELYNPSGVRVTGGYSSGGYYRNFSIKIDGRKVFFTMHRLVAYQKFGDALFEDGVVVRHLDGNSKNNLSENIAIGSYSDNEMDKPVKMRVSAAHKASRASMKYDHKKVIVLCEKGLSYREIMEELGIASEAAISYIVNSSMAGDATVA